MVLVTKISSKVNSIVIITPSNPQVIRLPTDAQLVLVSVYVITNATSVTRRLAITHFLNNTYEDLLYLEDVEPNTMRRITWTTTSRWIKANDRIEVRLVNAQSGDTMSALVLYYIT
jgi:hypothetical protein